jgi:hypothetical protein
MVWSVRAPVEERGGGEALLPFRRVIVAVSAMPSVANARVHWACPTCLSEKCSEATHAYQHLLSSSCSAFSKKSQGK